MSCDYDYFLLIAEELNISRAAKRAYISQQSLSKYLKNLEEIHNAVLFTRKPEFALTPAGKIVLEKAVQIKLLQSDMRRELAELNAETRGTIRFGIPPGRGDILLPLVFPEFHERYPNINLITKFDMTNKLRLMILNGTLDLMIGVNPSVTPELHETMFYNEPFCIVASNMLLQRYFPADFPQCKIRFTNGVDIREFQDIPLIGNSPDSQFYQLVRKYLEHNRVTPHEIFQMDTGLVHLKLVQQGIGVCFLPLMLKQQLVDLNHGVPAKQQLNAFPLKGRVDSSRISLLYLKNRTITPYMDLFISLLSEKIADITQPSITLFQE